MWWGSIDGFRVRSLAIQYDAAAVGAKRVAEHTVVCHQGAALFKIARPQLQRRLKMIRKEEKKKLETRNIILTHQ